MDEQDNQEETIETPEEEKEVFDVREYLGITEEDNAEQVAAKVKDKLGVTIEEMKAALSQSVQARAEELTLDFVSLAPLGDYDKLLENNDDMANFLKTEGHKSKHWQLCCIRESDVNPALLSFTFYNMGVDQGDTLRGMVYTTKSGKIRHAHAVVED